MELHLASMENITCWAFRKLFNGATDSYTGVLSLNYLLRKRNWKEVDMYSIPGQRQWIQIATAQESECKKFIERLLRQQKEDSEKYNAYGIQLNLSCPSPHITKIGQGPALIQRSKKVANLVRELLKQDKFKVSVKTRLGLNEEEVKQGKLFQMLSELKQIKNPNFSHVVVHFKHAREASYTPYDYSLLKKINDYNIPMIINGGINNYNDFLKITAGIQNKQNIIGFMIGREALKNPDCFIDSSNRLNKTNFSPRNAEKVKKEFEDNCKIQLPKEGYVRTIREYCPWAKDLDIVFFEPEKTQDNKPFTGKELKDGKE